MAYSSFDALLDARHSVRSYTGADVTEAQLDELLKSAVKVPNACNMQSWHFFTLAGNKAASGAYPDVYHNEWIKNAGALIIVCTDSESIVGRFGERGENLFALQDTAAATLAIMLKAREMGLGTCWVGAFDEVAVVSKYCIPARYRPVALIPVGYEDSVLPKKERRAMSDVVTVLK